MEAGALVATSRETANAVITESFIIELLCEKQR
jgi:hypothetical protein